MSTQLSSFDRWLVRLVRIAAMVCLLAAAGVLWQVAALVGELRQGMTAIGSRMERAAATVDRLADEVDALGDRVDTLRTDTRQALHVDDVRQLAASMTDLHAGMTAESPEPVAPEAAQEIDHLLGLLQGEGLTYAAGDNTDSPTAFRLKAELKRRTYADAEASAERFIDRISTETFGDRAYVVRFPDGDERPVRDWLRDELDRYRREAPHD
ncbi:MAG: DUF5329 family protein [Phycisphaeraceae bacterium]